jgi:hypothetical protein
LVDAFERRNPRADEVGGITRAEKAFGADKQLGMVLMPAHTLSGLESFRELLLGFCSSEGHLKCSRQEDRAGFVGHRKSLFFAEVEFASRRVVGDVAAGGLCAQPLAYIAFGGAGALGKFRGSLRSAGRKSFV